MEELREFIKNLNIMYVEDEAQAREISQKIFKRIFKSVDSFENGLEGYLAFQKKASTNEQYDLIISDINMPKMDGIEMLEKIREIDTNVPVIFVTARNESNVLLKAIELEVVNYLIKPIDTETMTNVVFKTCEKIYLKSSLVQKQKELEIYLKTIEQITYVTKINKDKNITYINDNFTQLLGKKAESIINTNYQSVIDSATNPKILNEIDEHMNEAKLWEGTLKSVDFENQIVYLKTIIMPIFDSTHTNVKEYLAIRYEVTSEENEKKELNKKILQNIAQFKKKAYSIAQDNQKTHQDVVNLKKYILSQEEQIKHLKESKDSLLVQLESYEKSQLSNSNGKLNLIRQKNDDIEQLTKQLNHIKHDKEELHKKIEELKETLEHDQSIIKLYKNDEARLKEKVKNLEDIIFDLENRLKGTTEKKDYLVSS